MWVCLIALRVLSLMTPRRVSNDTGASSFAFELEVVISGPWFGFAARTANERRRTEP